MTDKSLHHPPLDDIGTIDPIYPIQPLRQVSAGPLSSTAGYRLLVEGPCGTREVSNLIRQLEAMKEVFHG